MVNAILTTVSWTDLAILFSLAIYDILVDQEPSLYQGKWSLPSGICLAEVVLMDNLAWCSHLILEIVVFVCVSIENILSDYLEYVLATCNSTDLILAAY